MAQYRNKKFLNEKYVVDRLTPEQIGDICGTNGQVVRHWLRKYKIHRKRLPQASARKRNKRAALDYKGNCCCYCGYDRCETALEFHHVNPEEKKFTISSGLGRPWKTLKRELDKCVLLCCNCHRELHSGLIPLQDIAKYLIRYNKKRRKR